MKQTIELTCATCGKKFTAEADFIIEGIDGAVTKQNGERVIFIDPTAEHHCTTCILEAWVKAKEAAFESISSDDA